MSHIYIYIDNIIIYTYINFFKVIITIITFFSKRIILNKRVEFSDIYYI